MECEFNPEICLESGCHCLPKDDNNTFHTGRASWNRYSCKMWSVQSNNPRLIIKKNISTHTLLCVVRKIKDYSVKYFINSRIGRQNKYKRSFFLKKGKLNDLSLMACTCNVYKLPVFVGIHFILIQLEIQVSHILFRIKYGFFIFKVKT